MRVLNHLVRSGTLLECRTNLNRKYKDIRRLKDSVNRGALYGMLWTAQHIGPRTLL